jgi:hypothetical protein
MSRLQIGTSVNSQPITDHFSGTGLLTFAVWSGGDCQNITLSLAGAMDGDTVVLGVPNALASLPGVQFTGFVSATGQINVRGCKVTPGASPVPNPAVVRVDVWRH